MLRIGLTGGMGCGKTTVAEIFNTLGVPVYFADDAAKRLMHTDEILKSELIKFFGSDVYINGQLNKSALSARVFGDRAKLNKLNSLVHPATIKDSQAWMIKQNAYYSIKEAALIFESNSESSLDFIIGVSS
ncbi:MAG: dephospho-CoA kinase, partial [Ferruginibacter sp.]